MLVIMVMFVVVRMGAFLRGVRACVRMRVGVVMGVPSSASVVVAVAMAMVVVTERRHANQIHDETKTAHDEELG